MQSSHCSFNGASGRTLGAVTSSIGLAEAMSFRVMFCVTIELIDSISRLRQSSDSVSSISSLCVLIWASTDAVLITWPAASSSCMRSS